MHFLIKVFCIILVLNNYEAGNVTEDEAVFRFKAMPLCHSGLLITWKPNDARKSGRIIDDRYFFTFKVNLVEKKQNTSIEILKDSRTYFNTEEQHKIHSLNESSLYEIEIFQKIRVRNSRIIKRREDGIPINQSHIVRMKTNSKCKGTPAKPDFKFIPDHFNPSKGEIKWYPCGSERNCTNQESGTHFGIIIEALYNTNKLSELQVNIEELHKDYVSINIWPGRIYEVVVYSVNDKYITYSDLQEIFAKIIFSQVQYVKAISLPDLSVLLSWKMPKYSGVSEEIVFYYVDCFNISYSKGDQILLPRGLSPLPMFVKFSRNEENLRRRIFSFQPEVTYNCIIFPCDQGGVGYEYRVEYKPKVYDHELQIAKPDFNYHLILELSDCSFVFQWLPCGQSFECKNTRPGSNYTFLINPEPLYSLSEDYDSGDMKGIFLSNVVYTVTVKSSIANMFSEPVTKIFKNCVEIRRKIPLGAGDEN